MLSIPSSPNETSHFLGQLLLERRAALRDVLIPLVLALVMFVGGPSWSLWEAQRLQQPLPAKERVDTEFRFLLGCFVFCGSFALAGYCAYSMFNVLRCYELGITRATPIFTSTLRFDELASFTFSQRRQSPLPFLSIGSTYLLHFFPLPQSRKRPILVSIHVVRGAEVEIEAIRDHVADIIRERMEGTLQAFGGVPWTPFMVIVPSGLVVAILNEHSVEPGNIQLTAEGVSYTEADPWRLIPWAQVELRLDGSDYLQVIDKSKGTVELKVNQINDNFYPGLALATDLLAENSRPKQ